MALGAAALIFVLDRISKIVALNNLAEFQSVAVIPGIFHFTLIFNKGIAFGLFRDGGIFFTFVSALAVLILILYSVFGKNKNRAISVSLGLVLGGAAGNLADRVFYGYVVDFLDFRIWPVFNMADSAITIGMISLALCILYSSR